MNLKYSTFLSNDPENAARVIETALSGDVDAQFMAGLLYAEGRGVPLDKVQSFYWLTRAFEQGDLDADRLRCLVGSQMSDDEFSQAEKLIRLSAESATRKATKSTEIRH